MKKFLEDYLRGFAAESSEPADNTTVEHTPSAGISSGGPSGIPEATHRDGTAGEMEAFLRAAFEENYETLRITTGAALSPDAKEVAFQHVLLYWRKMRDVAKRVTETEVKLTLPAQKTPGGRSFGIEGVVDIVREQDETVMYDIKTHDVDSIRSNRSMYERQLNVYAYIWQHLRGQPLDRTAVISTAYPEPVKAALETGNDEKVERALAEWDPVVEIPFDELRVEETVEDFGRTVDLIEDGRYAPASLERLQSRQEGSRTLFASRVCSNCDARFACSSYRAYAMGSDRRREARFRTFFADVGSDLDSNARLNAVLDQTPDAEDLSNRQ